MPPLPPLWGRKDRIAFWGSDILDHIDQLGDDERELAAASFAHGALGTADEYIEHKTQRAVCVTTHDLARRDDIGLAFAQKFLDEAHAAVSLRGKQLTSSASAYMMCMLCSALEVQPTVLLEASDAELNLHLSLLGDLLRRSTTARVTTLQLRRAYSALRSLFASRGADTKDTETLLSRTASWILAVGAEPSDCVGGACVLAAALLSPPVSCGDASSIESLRVASVKLVVNGVVLATQPPEAATMQALETILGVSPASAWEASVLPAVLKALKRAPDAALALLPTTLRAVSSVAAITAGASELAEALLPHVLGTHAARAATAVSVLESLSQYAGTAAAAAAAAAIATAATKGSSLGPQQRESIASAFSALALPSPAAVTHRQVAGKRGVGSLGGVGVDGTRATYTTAASEKALSAAAEGVHKALLPLVAKESTESVRTCILVACGKWLALGGTAAAAVTAFSTGLGEKSAEIRRGYVNGLLAALHCDAVRGGTSAALVAIFSSQGEALLSPLKAVSKKRPSGAARADALAYLCVLSEASAICPALDKACAAEKIWTTTLKSKDSFVWDCEEGAPSERELLLSARLLLGIIGRPSVHLSLCGDGGVYAYRGLVQLASADASEARRAALYALACCSGPEGRDPQTAEDASGGETRREMRARHASSSMLKDANVACFKIGVVPCAPSISAPADKLVFAMESAVKKGAHVAAESEDAAEAGAAAAVRATRLRRVLHTVLRGVVGVEANGGGGDDALLDGLLPRLLMLCHSPALLADSPSGDSRPWNAFCALCRRSGYVRTALKRNAKVVAALLSGDSGALARNESVRTAALGALSSVLPIAADELVPELLPSLQPTLSELVNEVGSASYADLRVLQTEEGRLSTDPPPSAAAAEAQSGSGVTGDDFEKKVRASLQKKGVEVGKKGGKDAKESKGPSKAELMRQQQAATESTTRARLRGATADLGKHAHIISAIFTHAPAAAAPYLPELLPMLLPLPAMELLHLPVESGTNGEAWLRPLFVALVGGGGAALRSRRAPVGQALYESVRASTSSSPTLRALLPPILTGLHTELRHALPPSALALLMPLLTAQLGSEPSDDAEWEAQAAAFALLAAHCESKLPLSQQTRRQQAALLLSLMARGERWHERAAAALNSLAAALQPGSLAELTHAAIYGATAAERAAATRALEQVSALREGWHGADEVLAAKLWLLRCDKAVAQADGPWRLYALCVEGGDGDGDGGDGGGGDGNGDGSGGDGEGGAALPASLEAELLPLLGDPVERVRMQAAEALAAAAAAGSKRLHTTLTKLFDTYKSNLPPPPKEQNHSGRRLVMAADKEDDASSDEESWRPRQGVALCLSALAPTLKAREQLPVVFAFFKRALADPHEAVAHAMVAAGRQIIDKQSSPVEMVALLSPMFDAFLAEPATTETADRVRQGVVLYMGALARHIPADDPRVQTVIARLIEALSTPSEAVQRTISQSLASLFATPAIKPKGAEHLAALQNTLLSTPSFAQRRGAAFGLAGVVKGLGIPALKQHGVMAALQAAVEEKKRGDVESNAREGALHAFECLCEALGRLFEPYVISILPLLLNCVADGAGGVRHAAVAASQRIMGQLSAQGVKMVLPSLLRALGEEKWRTKHAAVELLGAMAYCAPKQLSNTLPQVVPALSEVLMHSHPRVKESANSALASVGAVIKNPEISLLVPTLLDAISEPATHTAAALDALAHCHFEHCVDPPSLALIVPVLHRGLRERAATSKRKTAHIAGNMCSLLSERRDIVPYLPLLLPELQAVLLDPIPEVRTTGAKALGRLCAGLGEEHFPQLLPWLRSMLVSDSSAVERTGAAQGLAHVLAALGDDKVAETMPDLLNSAHADSAVGREGYALLWVHMPAVLGERFETYLPDVLPILLTGLADDFEPVRETSMKGIQTIISTYLEASAMLLLPPLQNGLTDENYRIRQSSVELLGELMLLLTDKQPMEVLEVGEEVKEDSLLSGIPNEQQHAMLASLYIARNDVSVTVRQAAVYVWKTLVTNTPRTLRILLPRLTDLLIAGLSSEEEEPQEAAARALGELVSKLGERVLPTLIPIMQSGLNSENVAHRTGVCLGLSELMAAGGKEQVTRFLDGLIPAVRSGLCDEAPPVYEAAARAFATLQRLIGAQAVMEIVPSMLALLKSDEPDEIAMGQRGLREVVAQRPSAVVPYLLPRLCAPPLSLASAIALQAVAPVAGEPMYAQLEDMLPALMNEIYVEAELAPQGKHSSPELRDALLAACEAVCLAVDDDGFHFLMPAVLGGASVKAEPHVRAVAATLLATLALKSEADMSSYVAPTLQALLFMFHAPQPAVVRAGWGALDAVVKGMPKERYLLHVTFLREQLRAVGEECRNAQISGGGARDAPVEIAGLCLKKGLAPLAAVFLHGLMTGSPDLRETSAAALGEAIGFTSAAALGPFVVQITGPLIRIVGDRFPWGVKAAILQTLKLLIGKGAMLLKPFVPQLQTTFVKALADPTKTVRLRGAAALSALVALSTRIEPLTSDLTNSLASAEPGVAYATLVALAGVLRNMPKPLSDATLDRVKAAAVERLLVEDEQVDVAAASLVGACAKWCDVPTLLDSVETAVEKGDEWKGQLAELRVHLSLLRTLPASECRPIFPSLMSSAEAAATADRIELRQPATHALARVAAAMAEPHPDDVDELGVEEAARVAAAAVPAQLLSALGTTLLDRALDVRQSAVHAVKTLARLRPSLFNGNGVNLPSQIIANLATACQDKRNTLLQNAAQRSMMHVVAACGWGTPDKVPRGAALPTEASIYCADFLRRSAKRIAAMDSEAEDSDTEAA